MASYDLFSKRMKRQRGEYPDVYQYTNLPPSLRAQVCHIMLEGIGSKVAKPGFDIFERIELTLKKEHGLLDLPSRRNYAADRIEEYFLRLDTERALDVVELVLLGTSQASPRRLVEFTDEINLRFREAGVGYQVEDGLIFRVDSQFIHSEVVQPALAILSETHLKGAQEEFLNAHTHYRSNAYKECLNDCLKAFESTMKGICARRKWEHDPKATAKALLDLLFTQGLIPQLMQSHFSGLRSTLEAGVPTVRNKLAGHGQGPTPVPVPQSIASYVLHLTATNIVFLAKLDSEQP